MNYEVEMSKRFVMTISAVLLLAVSLSTRVFAGVGNVLDCAGEKSQFDDPSVVTHEYVKGTRGNRLYLHPDHPALCRSPDEGACKATSYIVSADAVAVGSNCGAWSYVQYLGRKGFTQGWVEARRLTETVPHPLRDPGVMPGNVELFGGIQYRFTLTEGHGRPVCEAYLKRLNASSFKRPPYCGRPENGSVPGFAILNREQLTLDEIHKLIGRVSGFMSSQHQNQPDIVNIFDGHGHVVKGEAWTVESIKRSLDMHVWRYNPQVDIDNDGQPDNLVVWHGNGADTVDAVCGATYPGAPGGERSQQIAFPLTSDSTRVDEPRMRAMFEYPGGGYPDDEGHLVRVSQFRPIGTSMSIFEYDGQYYFDIFFDGIGDFNNQRRGEAQLFDTLGVFLRKDNQTHQMCEYFVDATVPEPSQ